MTKTAHSNYLRLAAMAMAMLAAVLMALAGAKPAEAALAWYPEGHGPIAFEKEGDIWVASIMHLTNLTPDTAAYNDVDPVVAPDGRKVAFASDRGGADFEIYTVDVSSGELKRLTDNAVSDRDPVWSPIGEWINYEAPYFSSPTHTGVFLAKAEGTSSEIPAMSGDGTGGSSSTEDPYIDRHAEVVARYHEGTLR